MVTPKQANADITSVKKTQGGREGKEKGREKGGGREMGKGRSK